MPDPSPAHPEEPAAAGVSKDCHVCGDPIAGPVTLCNNCDRPFHLRQREDDPGPDCGDVWINEQYLSLEFACDICLGKRHAHGREEPPVGSGH